MTRYELIGHEGSVPFLGVWVTERHGIVGIYWCGKRTKFFTGSMFGKTRIGPRRPIVTR